MMKMIYQEYLGSEKVPSKKRKNMGRVDSGSWVWILHSISHPKLKLG
jgi:hypothetical protein